MSENHNDNFMQQDNQHDNVGSTRNLYKSQYEQQLANLEENAPKLNNPVDMAVNKKAIIFIILAGFGMTALGVFVYHLFSEQEESQQPVRAEIVSVPDLPPPDPLQVDASQQIIPVTTEKESNSSKKSSDLSNLDDFSSVPQETESLSPIQITRHSPPLDNPNPDERKMRGWEEYSKMQLVEPNGSIKSDNESFVQGGDLANTATAQVTAARYMPNRDKLLVKGTYLRCILETKIVSEIPGFTSCIITEPVYSSSGKHMLLPKGSKVMGQYGSSNPTSKRLGVVWDRIITPEGIDVTLKSPGVDNLGASGHVGKFKSHWPSRLGSALLISMISDVFKIAASEYGPEGKTVTTSTSTEKNPYESETVETLKNLAINQLDRNNARPNTVTINQGSLINIYTAQDIDFSSVIQ